MANVKKYNGSTWENAVVRKYGTASEIITPPTTIYCNGQPITTYTIKGNTVQSGTPSPSNPVSVNGTGDRTENLYNIATVVENTFIKANTTGTPLGSEISNNAWSCSDYIEVSPNTEYTVQYPVYVNAAAAGLVFFTSKSVSSAIEGVTTATQGSKTYTFTTPNNCNYVRFSWGNNKGNETMFVTGGTAKTYEPYGFKIPISSSQGTAYVYLNEPLYKIGDTADTINADGTVTRRIGKKVIDGTENLWTLYEMPTIPSSYNYALYQFYTTNSLSLGGVQKLSCYSDIAPYGYTAQTRQQNDLGVYLVTNGDEIAFQMEAAKSSFPDVVAWTTYLSQNPVTVYYIKATPTTEQITLPSIPTTDGANTITVDTTIQPSEFTATWTGWHDSTVKEWDGSDWQ